MPSDRHETCPICGSPVVVEGDPVEGTMHYEPLSPATRRPGWEAIARELYEGLRKAPGFPTDQQIAAMQAFDRASLGEGEGER